MNEIINIKDYFDIGIKSLKNELNLLRDEYKNSIKILNESSEIALESLNIRFEYIEKSTIKAEIAAEKRFESINEFRAQLRDQQNTFVTKNEMDIRFDNIGKKVDNLDAYQNSTQGKDNGINFVWGIIIVIISFILSGISIILSIFR